MSPFQPDTNFKDSDGVDLGKKLITKDYLLSVYPNLGSQNGFESGGQIWGWGGNNDSGFQVGANVNNVLYDPTSICIGGNNWKQVSMGGAIKTDGTLWVWGSNSVGQLGTNDTVNRSTPVTTFSGGTDWKFIRSPNSNTSMAIKTDGTLWVWGQNYRGMLGINDTVNRSTPVTTFIGGTNWKYVSNNTTSLVGSYGIKTDGTMWVWGPNSFGQLGTNDTIDKSTPVTTFTGGTDWKMVSSGGSPQSFGSPVAGAIKTDGTLWMCGKNDQGQLGKNFLPFYMQPVTTFAGGTNWANTATGAPEELYTISRLGSIKTDGTLWTWGPTPVGDNTGNPVYTPVTTFSGGANWKQILGVTSNISGTYQSLRAGIKTDGTLWTWGFNDSGALGVGGTAINARITPVTTFTGGANWKQVTISSDGSSNTTIAVMGAIKTDGTLWTWGRSGATLGSNTTVGPTNTTTPSTTFAGGINWKHVSSGFNHMLAIKNDGTLWTWGLNYNGSLGTNDLTARFTPVTTFIGGADWKQVSGGGNSSSAIKTDGTLWVWGRNNNAQLANNSNIDVVIPITTFAGGVDWKQISVGTGHMAAIKTDGTLWTWGNGSFIGINKLPIASNTSSTPVTTFAGGTNWSQVDCSYINTTALKTDGTLWVWGNNNDYGQMPVNYDPSLNRIFQKEFNNSGDWKYICCSLNSSSAIKTDGTLWVWGNYYTTAGGGYGSIGTFTPITTLLGGTDWKSLSMGLGPNINALKSDGTLWGWGYSGTVSSPPFKPYSRLSLSTILPQPVPLNTGFTDWKQISTSGSITTTIIGLRQVS